MVNRGGDRNLTAADLQRIVANEKTDDLVRLIQKYPELENSVLGLLSEGRVAGNNERSARGNSEPSDADLVSVSPVNQGGSFKSFSEGVVAENNERNARENSGPVKHQVGARKENNFKSLYGPKSKSNSHRNRSASAPSIKQMQNVLSAAEIFKDTLRPAWWPKKCYLQGYEEAFPCYENYISNEYVGDIAHKNWVYAADEKFIFSEAYQPSIELLTKVDQFLGKGADAFKKLLKEYCSSSFRNEQTLVLRNLMHQLNSANDSDLDPRGTILRYLSLEHFLRQSPQVLDKLKGIKAELDAKKIQRIALNQMIGVQLDKKLRMIESRIEGIEGYVEKAKQLVTKAGFTIGTNSGNGERLQFNMEMHVADSDSGEDSDSDEDPDNYMFSLDM